MGNCLSAGIENEINDIKIDENDPVSSKNRSRTDVFCLVVMSVFLASVLALIGYCAIYSDIFRVINGYDNCANVCGRVTPPDKNPKYSCKGANYTTKPLLLVRGTGRAILNPVHSRRECVSDCESHKGFKRFLTRCVPFLESDISKGGFEKAVSEFSFVGLSDFLEETSEDLHLCWAEMVCMCLVALALALVLLLMFRYLVGFVIWLILIGVVLASVVGTIFLWVLYVKAKKELEENEYPNDLLMGQVNSYLIFAISSTVVCSLVILIIVVMRKRINLLVRLFKEAGKAVNRMPLLLAQPILSSWVIAIVLAIWVYFTLVIQGSGYVAVKSPENLYYKKTFAMKFARWYNLFALFWFIQFVIGCQHMVIAGAVCKWFFTRKKDELQSPIINSFSLLIRYHLGTVAFGSFLIAVIQALRVILTFIRERTKNSKNQVLKSLGKAANYCLRCCESLMKYFTKNAYIETAIHGINFCDGGKRAFQLITNNILRVATINSVGDFILFLGKVFVVLSTVFFGIFILRDKEGILHVWVPITLAGIVAYILAHCFITVYEMVIDTIFVCFCEDSRMNDGISKPYYMSKGLMEFVRNNQKAVNRNGETING